MTATDAGRVDFTTLLAPGSGVWWSQAAAEPEPLVDQLLDQVAAIGPVRAFSGLTWNARFDGCLPADLTVQSYGGLGGLRALSAKGLLDVVPCHYSAIPRLFERGRLPSDVGLVQVSPPGPDGTVSLGIGVDYVADAVPHTGRLVAEINHRMPRTRGAAGIALDRFVASIETDRPLRESVARVATDADRRIASHVASLVEHGDTLQIGVGTLPNAVLEALSDHRDLGVHSGMITDGVARLIDKGVVTGARKEIDPGVVVAGSALGSEALYARIPTLPVEFRAASYTHAAGVLAELRSLVSINSAIEVDLLGQVGAEMSDGVHIGAIGGQADFSRAASLTGSRSIIALRSQVRGASTIVPTLGSGVVTTSRADVDAVVTEHGVAHLTACPADERARRLIAVAAPEHRETLERAFRIAVRNVAGSPSSSLADAG